MAEQGDQQPTGEQPETPTPTPTPADPVRLGYLIRASQLGKSGFAVVTDLLTFAAEGDDLGYFALDGPNALRSTDAVAPVAGLDPADVATMVGGILAINDVLNANSGAVRKAIRRVAAYTR